MLLFSRLRRFALTDDQGRRAKLVDFIVDLPAEGYPPVTHILFRHTSHELEVLPWGDVVSIDHATRQMKVKDIEAGTLAPPESLKKKVLMTDIDDAMVLDLKHHRAARA